MSSFESFGISPEILKSISDMGFLSPMPIQEKVIPEILSSDRDIIALAQTGTGKTGAFGLPLLSMIEVENQKPQVIILSPTRELCVQIANDIKDFSKYIKSLRVVAIYGGTSIEKQIRDIKDGVQIIVATPGRMHDVIRRKKVNLTEINTVVLDEADVMLDMGFSDDLNAILDNISENRRTLLFSATMPKEMLKITKQYMKDPLEITMGERNSGTSNVSHHYYVINAKDRYLALKRIIDFYPNIYGIIFCRTRSETAEVAEKLMKDGYHADALHGDLGQSQRDYTMNRFRMKNLQLLVATDVAARGIDIDNLTHIINYNLPDDAESYNHRSGRTGRADKLGTSISIIHQREKYKIANYERSIKQKFEHKDMPTGFEVCKKQLLSMVNKMENVVVNNAEIESFLPEVFAKLSGLSKEDIITRFVSMQFNRFLDYYRNAPDLNVEEKREDRNEKYKSNENCNFTVIRINVGKMDGLTVKMLISMINKFMRNNNVAIGKADIREFFTLFAIDSNHIDDVFDAFRNKEFEGRKIVIEVARKRDQVIAQNSFGGERQRTKSNSNYKKNKDSFDKNRKQNDKRSGKKRRDR